MQQEVKKQSDMHLLLYWCFIIILKTGQKATCNAKLANESQYGMCPCTISTDARGTSFAHTVNEAPDLFLWDGFPLLVQQLDEVIPINRSTLDHSIRL